MTQTAQPVAADPLASPVPAAPAAVTATPPCVPGAMMTRILTLGVAAGLTIFVGGVVLAFGESAENKLKFFQAAAFPFSVIVGATLAALGFSNGKLLENVIPAGYQPAARAMAQALAARAGIPPAALVPIIGVTPNAAAPAATQSPSLVSPTPTPPAGSPQSPMMSFMLPLLLGIALLSGGCVGTSQAFKSTIGGGINNAVLDMRDYTALADWDTNHNGMIDAEEQAAKAKESADTENLAASVAEQSKITLEGVESPWRIIEPAYRRYIQTDRTLLTPEDKKIRTDTPDAINRVIELERQRQASIWAWLGVKS